MTKTLITGATGTIGRQTAEALLAAGETEVRVGVRRPEAAAGLAEAGANVVRLDLEDPSTFGGAFAGVDRLFLLGPQGREDFGEDVKPILDSAKAANVGHVVRLSALGANADADFALGRGHGIGEDHVKASGLAWTIIQPTFFQDNVVKYTGGSIQKEGAFYGASNTGKTAYVSSADIARVTAAVLAKPDEHVSKTYVLTGPEAFSDDEVATLLSEVTGNIVKYVNVTPEQLRGAMTSSGAPDWLADSFVALEAVKAAGWAEAITTSVKDLTGREPETYRAFLQRNRAQLV